MTKRITELEKREIINLYNKGLNCVEIKNKLNLKGHQQVLNVLNKLDYYIPYRNGRSKIRKFSLNENYFEKIDTEQKSYILGFICADGHVDTVRKSLRFLVQTLDRDILEKIKIELGSDTYVKDVIRETPFDYGKPLFYHSSIEFNSTKMNNDLIKLGLNKVKTYSLNSSIIKTIPKSMIRHFLRGYFDGDGGVLFGKKYTSGIKYNIDIVGNLEFLQNTFGKYFPTTNKYYFHKKSKQCWSYKLSSKENVTNFLKYLYYDSTISLNRKHSVYLKACGHLKQEELLGTPTLERQKEDNQQPSLTSNSFEGSTTNSQILTSNVEDSNANTSILQSKKIEDIV